LYIVYHSFKKNQEGGSYERVKVYNYVERWSVSIY